MRTPGDKSTEVKELGHDNRDRTARVNSQDDKPGQPHDSKDRAAGIGQPRRDNSGGTAMAGHSRHDT